MTPRIDTLLNTIDSVQSLLDEIRPHLIDVHDLAQTRSKGGDGIKVHGGDHDYALDDRGDPTAKELWNATAASTIGLGRNLESNLKALRRFLNQHGSALRRNGQADVTSLEHSTSRYAQRRRYQRGEHVPVQLISQPERRHHLDPVMELDALQAAVRKLAKHLDREHGDCRNANGRRRVKWLDRSVLSPAQRDAIDRALIGQRDEATA